MPFPAAVKTEALVRAARRCCVCRLPKGTFLEVHHIVPEADGGHHTIENAIPLCFDCHASAGHYNSRQPKGNKFSPDELRRHRDNWYEVVLEHALLPSEGPALACQYMIVSAPEVCADILTNNVAALPFGESCLLFPKGDVAEFQGREVMRSLRNFNLGSTFESFTHYEQLGDYLREHRDARRSDGSTEIAVRPFTREYLQHVGAPQLDFLLESSELGSSIEQLAHISATEGECGSDTVVEQWVLPTFVCIWVLVTNVSDRPVTLRALRGVREETDERYAPRCLNLRSIEAEDFISLPPAPILPGQSVLLPVASAYAVSGAERVDSECIFIEPIAQASYQTFASLRDLSILSSSWIVGPAFWPVDLEYLQGGRIGHEAVHTLEPTNTFTVQRGLEVGSCPHMFTKRATDHVWEYLRPVLVGALGREVRDVVDLPPAAREACIVELEYETTRIRQLVVGDSSFADIALAVNEGISFDVSNARCVEIVGSYDAIMGSASVDRAGVVKSMGTGYFEAHSQRFSIEPLQVNRC